MGVTRRSFVAAATTILALLLQAAPVRAADPVPPAPGLTLRLADRGNGGAQYEWLDAEGRVYDLGPERWINEPAAPVPGIALPAVYGDVDAALGHAAATYGVAPGCLRNIAWRESRNRPWVDNAQGSGARGLMQFKDGTWAFMAPQAGYGGASVYDGWAAAHVAAWAIANPGPSQGGLRHWGGSC